MQASTSGRVQAGTAMQRLLPRAGMPPRCARAAPLLTPPSAAVGERLPQSLLAPLPLQQQRHCASHAGLLPSARRRGGRLAPAASAAAAAGAPGEPDTSGAQAAQQQQQQQQQPAGGGGGDPFASAGVASSLYAALAAALAAAGAALGVFGPQAAAACLKLQSTPPAAAGALVACFGAVLLRAASVCWSIKVAADAGQLATWRVQRLNAALCLSAAAVAAQQALGAWAGGQPWTLLAAVAGGAAVAAATGRVLWACRPLDGGVEWACVGRARFGDAREALSLFGRDAARTLTSLPACLLVALAAAAGGAAAAAAALPPPPVPGGGALDPGVGYLRGLLAAGLPLLAAQAAALAEAAQDVRPWSAVQLTKFALVNYPLAKLSQQQQAQPLLPQQQAGAEGGAAAAAGAKAPAAAPAPAAKRGRQRILAAGVAPPAFFASLHVGLFASLGLQAAWLLAAADSSALPLNAPDPVWALQYWTVMLGAAYLVTTVRTLDWGSIWGLVINGLGAVGSVLVAVLGATFLNWGWLQADQR
ncbi:hypothetical protein Rsub_07702 [Raphidocelis subcapitata]|uniref:Uncharacterized protein n=1 Tax=Raphidocelis subcapitata TaxID=307507 RepID=A0A2V0P5I7_9CHLO|nr:hypothetical protein Rsub_07702 [Raphidocelis subcapitata]|eukprot:GBF95118.1 hypothetical protein Rsub_07702 [Raphidocelis subcapitata]